LLMKKKKKIRKLSKTISVAQTGNMKLMILS